MGGGLYFGRCSVHEQSARAEPPGEVKLATVETTGTLEEKFRFDC